jgi:hypothetical protein
MRVIHSSMLIKRSVLIKHPYNLRYKIASDYNMLLFLIASDYIFHKLNLNSHTITDIGISTNSEYKSIWEILLINKTNQRYYYRTLLWFIYSAIRLSIIKIIKKMNIYCLLHKF